MTAMQTAYIAAMISGIRPDYGGEDMLIFRERISGLNYERCTAAVKRRLQSGGVFSLSDVLAEYDKPARKGDGETK